MFDIPVLVERIKKCKYMAIPYELQTQYSTTVHISCDFINDESAHAVLVYNIIDYFIDVPVAETAIRVNFICYTNKQYIVLTRHFYKTALIPQKFYYFEAILIM